MTIRRAILIAAALLSSAPAWSAECRNVESFERWLEAFKAEAVKQGVSPATIATALKGVSFDQGVIDRDRRQSVFAQNFLEFSDRMVSRNRLIVGAQRMARMRTTFAKIEQEYGVPPAVITAFWGLETDFGQVMGKLPTLRSLASLAYDCRRPETFRPQLLAALRIIDRGDLAPGDMIGAWAGELGQMQFLPSHYLNEGVDFDGDGRRDLLKSDSDALASSANFLKGLGWRRGEPWLQEARVPAKLAWDQADLTIQHPRSDWAKRGVTLADGKPLPADSMPASLILPMGRRGPAFLAYPNFQIYLKWNQSLVYTTTAAYFASRLAGAPPLTRGDAAKNALNFEQIKDVQRLLVRQGHDVGEADGKIGSATRAAVRAMQIKLGLPADAYPTIELLDRLRALR